MPRRSLMSMLLPTPDQIVRSYMTTDETIVLLDQPSTNAFLVEAAKELIAIGIVVLLIGIWMGGGGDTTVAAMALTAKEMNSKYKETSEGGLAVSVTLC